MRFLMSLILTALFIGGCGATGIGRMNMEIERPNECRAGDSNCDASFSARVSGIANPVAAAHAVSTGYARVRAADGRREVDHATAVSIERGYGAWGMVPMSDAQFFYGDQHGMHGMHPPVVDSRAQQRDEEMRQLRQDINGVVESQRRLVEGLRGQGGEQ